LNTIDTSHVGTRTIAERLESFGLVPYKCGLIPGREAFTLIAARARYRAAIRYAQNGQLNFARNGLRTATQFAKSVATISTDARVRSDARAMLVDFARTRYEWRNKSDAGSHGRLYLTI